MNKDIKDKVRGSLVGGAIGDALGYAVEFKSRQSILNEFGKNGITKFSISSANGQAIISDDTQMTLFTANGLLNGVTQWYTSKAKTDLAAFVNEAYKEWYQTQTGNIDHQKQHKCWIRDIKKLNVQRAPGLTCMSALAALNPENDSKGCGGIMRVAPVALLIASEICRGHNTWTAEDVQTLAAKCAAITHKHPMGYICAAVFADVVFQVLMCEEHVTSDRLIEFIENANTQAHNIFTKKREAQECDNLKLQIDNAINLSKSNLPDHEAIYQLGEGWTGDEALTISLFCTLRHIDDFHAAMVAAVNHNGDSDSTGAVCGNLIGAIVGATVFDFPDLHQLELKDLLLVIADDIVNGCPLDGCSSPSNEQEKQWEKRYIFGEENILLF